MSYAILLIEPGKAPETLLEGEQDLNRVRAVAASRSVTKRLSKGLGRRLEILCDGKVLKGGASALDGAVYSKWLEDNQPIEGSHVV